MSSAFGTSTPSSGFSFFNQQNNNNIEKNANNRNTTSGFMRTTDNRNQQGQGQGQGRFSNYRKNNEQRDGSDQTFKNSKRTINAGSSTKSRFSNNGSSKNTEVSNAGGDRRKIFSNNVEKQNAPRKATSKQSNSDSRASNNVQNTHSNNKNTILNNNMNDTNKISNNTTKKNKTKNKTILKPLSKEKEKILGSLVTNPSQFGFKQHVRAPRELPKFMLRQKPQLYQSDFKQDSWDQANQKKMLQVEESNSNDTQGLYDLYRKMRVMERKMMENKNLVDKAEESKDLSEAIVFQGTCLDMCPIFERARRSLENNVSNAEKVEGKINRSRAIKAFARPAASAPPSLPSDVRPPHVLVQTLDYITENIIKNLPEGESFLWDRMRSIRQDFTYQNYCGPETVDCNERICRIHLLILHIMAKSDIEYSKQQEIEQLTKSLITLCEIYDSARLSSIEYPNEPEFRSYWLLHNMRDPECDFVIQNLPAHVINDKMVQLVLTFRRIISNSNFKERGYIPTPNGLNLYRSFFQLLSDTKTPFLVASFLESYVNEIRFYGFLQMKLSTNKKIKPISFQTFIDVFLFNNTQELIEFCQYYSIDIVDGDHISIQSLNYSNHLIPEKTPMKQAWLKCVDQKLSQCGEYKKVINVGASNFESLHLKSAQDGNDISLVVSADDDDDDEEKGEEKNNGKRENAFSSFDFKPVVAEKASEQHVTFQSPNKTISSSKSNTKKDDLISGVYASTEKSVPSSFTPASSTKQFSAMDGLKVPVPSSALKTSNSGGKVLLSTTPTPMINSFNKSKAGPTKNGSPPKDLNSSFDLGLSKSKEPAVFATEKKAFNFKMSDNPVQKNLAGNKERESNALRTEFQEENQIAKKEKKQLLRDREDQQQGARRRKIIENVGNQIIDEFCQKEVASIVSANLERYSLREKKLDTIAQELYQAFIHERLYLVYLESQAELQRDERLKKTYLSQWTKKWKKNVLKKSKLAELHKDVLKVEKSLGVVKKRNISMEYYLQASQKHANTLTGRYNHMVFPSTNEKREFPLDSLDCGVKNVHGLNTNFSSVWKSYFDHIYDTKQKLIDFSKLDGVQIDIQVFSDNWGSSTSQWLVDNFRVGEKIESSFPKKKMVLNIEKFDTNDTVPKKCSNIQLLVFNTGITDDDIFDLENKLQRDGELLVSILNSKSVLENNYKMNILLLYWESKETKFSMQQLFELFQIEKLFKIFGNDLIKRVDFLKIGNSQSMENLKLGLQEIAQDFQFELTSEHGVSFFQSLKKIQNERISEKRRLSNYLFTSNISNDDDDDDNTVDFNGTQSSDNKRSKIDEKLEKMLQEERVKYAKQQANNKKNTFKHMKPFTAVPQNSTRPNRKISVLNSESSFTPPSSHITRMNSIREEEIDLKNKERSASNISNFADISLTGIPAIGRLDESTKNMMRKLTFNYRNMDDLDEKSLVLKSPAPFDTASASTTTPTFNSVCKRVPSWRVPSLAKTPVSRIPSLNYQRIHEESIVDKSDTDIFNSVRKQTMVSKQHIQHPHQRKKRNISVQALELQKMVESATDRLKSLKK